MPQQWGWNQSLGYKDPNFGKPQPYHAASGDQRQIKNRDRN